MEDFFLNCKKPGPIYGYSDTDWAGDATTQCSTSGYIFMCNNAVVTWSLSLQPSVVHSTSDAEWRAFTLQTTGAKTTSAVLRRNPREFEGTPRLAVEPRGRAVHMHREQSRPDGS